MAEIIRHDPISIAELAADAPRVARNGIVYMKVLAGDDDPGGVMYEIKADGSARILNEDCEAVIEDGMITGYQHLEEAARA